MPSQTLTKHLSDCRMRFGKKDPSCPRCQELLAGTAPRTLAYTPRDRNAELAALNAAHSEHKRTCKICRGIELGVCTWGDW